MVFKFNICLHIAGQSTQNFHPLETFDSRLFENGTLSIQSASPQDEGYYLCKATNNIGLGLSKTVFIGVNGNYLHTFNNIIFW